MKTHQIDVSCACFSRRLRHSSCSLALSALIVTGGCHAATPYEKGFDLQYGLTLEGRILPCDGTAQPNCISTSSLTDAYSPPWLARGFDQSTKVLDQVEAALKVIEPEVERVEMKENKRGGVYCRFRVPSAYVEVLAEEKEEGIMVTYRSQAATVKYIWPIIQPVGDFGAQRKRMSALRQQLRWPIVGGACTEMECFRD